METIYKLLDPITNEVRYIGYTNKTLKRRLSAHIRDSINNNKTHKHKWIRSLLKRDLKPIIKRVKKIPKGKDWVEYEIKYIAKYSTLTKLTNGTLGGDGLRATEITKAKLRKARIGFRHTEETKELMRKAKLGKTGKDCPNSKGLIAYNDQEEVFFYSKKEAADYLISKGLKASSKNIGQCLNQKPYKNGKYIRKQVAGYKFRKPTENEIKENFNH